MEKKEREALYSAIQGFVGRWWNGSYLYPDPCGWTPIEGVSCDIFNGFCNNKISGGFSKSVQEMDSLEVMVLYNNPTGGDLMSIEWKKLQNLEFLDLSNMDLTGDIPESMTELKRLRFFRLNNNSLSGNVSPRFEAMPCLGAIYLNGNNFTGKLEFSEWFYGKMGSHFQALNNPNLCYSVGLMAPSHVPFGVQPCQQENRILDGDSIAKMGDVKWNKNPHFLVSLGFSSCGVDGFWWGFMAKEILIVLIWNMLL
ncbi:hypothetical protein F0562_025101 [Nyssa sinensis]|uniref:Leucine-rich repeat-containing N-terminal plant-type domain-containing protein n=1 Tax=Nyssa sinensis TaxID=561372 RepID=A0A5J5BDK1_9ASTE|nr:hypothetical protein F0562_025101 [Nyssa sinensis]